MCISMPGHVVEILPLGRLRVEMLGTVRRDVSAFLLQDEVHVGDWVAVHTGFAFERLDPEDAAATVALLRRAAS